jgi:WD40 repeat protein
MGGYKNRDPILTYYLLDQSMGDGDFPERRGLELPFTGGATHCAIDEERKLIFAADDSRIKSFAWGDYSDRSEAGTTFKKALPVHTLNSCDKPLKASGPIALLHDRVLRAGEGVIGVWNIDDLDQHVPGSKETIGARFDVSNTWREHGSVIEPSSGNKCHTSVTLEDGRFPIGTWHIHPSASGIMLAGFDQGYDGCYAIGLCHALDLESGKVAAKYIGHGAEVGGFSTSATEPNTFMTCCQDGYIRLFDTRQPLPVLTINESRYQSDNVSSALFIHPDGVPSKSQASESSMALNVLLKRS